MKTKLLKYFLASGMVLGCTGLASASDIFNYTGSTGYGPGTGAVPGETVGGISVTEAGVWAAYNNSGSTVTALAANAFTHSTGVGANANFATTYDALYAGDGLAVCNPYAQQALVNPTGSSCGSPDHQISNYEGLDFALFAFSTPVNLSSVQVQSFGNPTNNGGADYIDMSYAILTQAQETALLNGTLAFTSINFTTETTGSTSSSYTYSLSGTGEYVLIGAAVTANYGGNTGGQPDAFKIQDLTINPVTAVPEPASLLLIGSGLLAGAVFGRRRLIRKSDN